LVEAQELTANIKAIIAKTNNNFFILLKKIDQLKLIKENQRIRRYANGFVSGLKRK